ncbi:hypothetical protein C8Q76DRAFT_784983 [Earliella scabrosa]|nr:hypothetical protein C8Q76DRAFT_784983 [Earliella scabrosa]
MIPGIPPLSDNMVMRTRSTAYSPSWSAAIPKTPPSTQPAPRPARVVATPGQRVILKRFYERYGDEPAKEEIEEVARETGLGAKWIRKWVGRQRSKTRGRKSSGSTAAGSVGAMSPEMVTSPLLHQSAYLLQPPPAASGPRLTVIPKVESSQNSLTGPGVPGSGSGAVSPVLDRAAFPDSAYTLAGLLSSMPASTGSTSAAVTVSQPGPFTLPICAGASPPHPSHRDEFPLHVESSPLPQLFPQTIETTAVGTGISIPRAQGLYLPPAYPPPPSMPSPLLPQGPGGLTPSAAYLYQMLHEATAPDDALPEAPGFNSAVYLTELTRPVGATPQLRIPLSMASVQSPMLHPFAHDAMPVSYQMRLSDLMAWTKRTRQIAATNAQATVAQRLSQGQDPKDGAEPQNEVDLRDGRVFVNTGTPTVGLDPLGHELEVAESPMQDAAYPLALRSSQGDDTEDEDEVLTPCEEVDFTLDGPSKSVMGKMSANREPTVVDPTMALEA